MDYVRFLFGLAICFTFVASTSALAACGTLLGIQVYCPSSYHCCSEAKSTCCQDGYICISDDTTCLSIGKEGNSRRGDTTWTHYAGLVKCRHFSAIWRSAIHHGSASSRRSVVHHRSEIAGKTAVAWKTTTSF